MAAGPGTKARAFIFRTAGITYDGRSLSAVFRDALRCIHPDSAENRAATPDAPTTELPQRARKELKDTRDCGHRRTEPFPCSHGARTA